MDITPIISIIAVIITITIFVASSIRESHTRFIDNFNKLYDSTFRLRNEISKTTQKEYNEDFFYEIDYVLECEDVRNAILDYLTKMENFFFMVVGHKFVKWSFEKLMSLALYQRLSALWGLIIKLREINNNDKMFSNYEKVLKEIENMKKIKKHISSAKPKHYIGIRSSDTAPNNDYFKSNISIFSDHTTEKIFYTRPNQNNLNKEILPYYTGEIDKCIINNPDSQFMFYNGMTAYRIPPEYHNRFICLPSKSLLDFINNKYEVKTWLSENDISIIPFTTILGNQIDENTFEKHFNNTNKLIVQSFVGGGGVGTFLFTKDNYNEILKSLNPFQKYLISPYFEHSVSANTHIVISDKQTILSPGSIQIVELKNNQLCYRGADFISFRDLNENVRTQIKKMSLKIANQLRTLGYRGVAGIDFLIDDKNKVYCVEINPRFQASSFLIDMYLSNSFNMGNGIASSLFELNEQAYFNNMKTTLSFDDVINYSCYYYYKDSESIDKYIEKEKIYSSEGVTIHKDGFEDFCSEEYLNNESYLFRAVFSHAITSISPDTTLWICDNIRVHKKPQSIIELKIALLNQGVRVKNCPSSIKKGTYESIDISFCGEDFGKEWIDINCAYKVNFSQYSPYELNFDSHSNKLLYYGELLGEFKAEMDLLNSMSSTDKRILFLSTDRLRIKLVSGCEYKNLGLGCKFCNLSVSNTHFTKSELMGALTRFSKQNISFAHILVGGGTCISPHAWEDIIWLCDYLHNDPYYSTKPISLMSILPPIEVLKRLHTAGLREVAFNIEISNELVAKRLMPGKRRQEKEQYYSVLKEAVNIFGIGNVRSALIVGFDKKNDLIDEAKELAETHVIPCLSAFRALPNTEFEGCVHPSNSYFYEIYSECTLALKSTESEINELGPKCVHCRNNMLII